MAQAGQTHRRKDGTKGQTGSDNGARSHQKSGSRTGSSRQSTNGRQSGQTTNGSRSGKAASARTRTTSRSSSNGRARSSGQARAGSNGHDGRKSSGTATKKRTTGAATRKRTTSSRQSQRKPQRKSQQKAPRERARQSSGQTRSRQSKGSLPTPDPRWGLVPLTTAGIGGAAWAILHRRRRKRGLSQILDLDSAREALGRELGDATDLAQAAGRKTGRALRSGAKDAQSATKGAGRSTGRLLRSRAKDAESTAQAAGRKTGRALRSGATDAQGAAKSAGRGTRHLLRRGAKEIQSAIPDRKPPSRLARLRHELASHGQQLASQGQQLAAQGQSVASHVPSQAEDAWPVALALLPAAAYSAARLKAGHRIPIQRSVDVAVPVEVVFDQWMQLEFLPEGSHCVTEIERDDDGLTGKIAGRLRSIDWEAEILDERECESFAWRSVQGSDCAGLITFHRLSERLTRLELQLDVLPTRGREAIELSLHTADRRAEAELRRFKARLETMSPDTYEDSPDADETDQEDEDSRDAGEPDQEKKED